MKRSAVSAFGSSLHKISGIEVTQVAPTVM